MGPLIGLPHLFLRFLILRRYASKESALTIPDIGEMRTLNCSNHDAVGQSPTTVNVIRTLEIELESTMLIRRG